MPDTLPAVAPSPAPWATSPGKGLPDVPASGSIRVMAGTKLIAVLHYFDAEGRQQAEANARLVRLAPDLLAACQTAVRHLDPDLMGETPGRLIRAAFDGLVTAAEAAAGN